MVTWFVRFHNKVATSRRSATGKIMLYFQSSQGSSRRDRLLAGAAGQL